MKLLLGSGGIRTPERLSLWVQSVRHVVPEGGTILFVPYARADHDDYLASMILRGFDAGHKLESIHRVANVESALDSAAAVFVGGGNTFRLLAELYGRGLIGAIGRRVRAGLPYLGVSAGTNVACPTIQTTNDMPIIVPPTLLGLGLVPFQINAHYFHGPTFLMDEGVHVPHFGETRDERLTEFHEINVTPVLGLWEGGILSVDREHVTLLGTSARLFRRGRPPLDLPAGATWRLGDIETLDSGTTDAERIVT